MRRGAALLATVAVAVGAAAPAAALEVGIGDQAEGTLSDPLFSSLGVRTVRVVLPWDVIRSDPWRLARWANAASATGTELVVAFGAASGSRCPDAPCRLPSDDDYRAAFAELHQAYPWIDTFIPWNEPNHGSQPTASDPEAAARFAGDVQAVCGACRIIAGDLLDSVGMTGWLARYREALTVQPYAWGLHNYYDTTYFTTSNTDAFLSQVPGRVWITETGGIVTWRTSDGRVQLAYDEQRAAASLAFALRLAEARSDRVERAYVYQWRPGPADDFDAGLLRADGSPRPGFGVLRDWLTRSDGGFPAAARTPLRLRIRSLRAAGARRLRVRISCAGAPCRGRLTLEGRGWLAQRLVNGRTAAGSFRPRRLSFRIRGGHSRVLGVRLSRSVARGLRRRRGVIVATAVPATVGDFAVYRRAFRVRLHSCGRRCTSRSS